MPPPDTVALLMQQHIGAPCKPTVKAGDAVKVGQVVGDSNEYIAAPIHASVSGTVKAIKQVMLPSGQWSEAVVIESDGKMEPFEGIRPPQAETREAGSYTHLDVYKRQVVLCHIALSLYHAVFPIAI